VEPTGGGPLPAIGARLEKRPPSGPSPVYSVLPFQRRGFAVRIEMRELAGGGGRWKVTVHARRPQKPEYFSLAHEKTSCSYGKHRDRKKKGKYR